MIDPVTGQELDAAWRPMEEAKALFPKTAKEGYFHCLVLLDVRLSSKKERIERAKLSPNLSVVGNAFAFDMPPMIAWQHLPPIFKEREKET